jgi:hypothetical protein
MVAKRQRECERLVKNQGLALLRAVALLAKKPRRQAPPAVQLDLIFAATPQTDREAFARLATFPAGTAERALHRLVSAHGISSTADLLGLNLATDMMLGWIRVGAVPPSWATAIRGAAK